MAWYFENRVTIIRFLCPFEGENARRKAYRIRSKKETGSFET